MIIGAILALAGICSSGLWPWQLPASFFGGLIFSYGFTMRKNESN